MWKMRVIIGMIVIGTAYYFAINTSSPLLSRELSGFDSKARNQLTQNTAPENEIATKETSPRLSFADPGRNSLFLQTDFGPIAVRYN